MYKAKLTKSTGDYLLDKRIIELTEQNFNTDNTASLARYPLTTTLLGCFEWSKTTEGIAYWKSIARTVEIQVEVSYEGEQQCTKQH